MASTGIHLELHNLNGTPDNRVQEVQFGLNLKGAGRVEGCSALGGCYLKNRKRGPLDVRLGLEPVSDDEEDVSISILEKIMILCLGPQASTLTQVQRGALGRSSTEIHATLER